jgi:threonine/homoserine/homoserine lactone efflux protein
MLKGVWLGFCIAAPVGPIGLLVLKQSLERGRWAGLASGLGAALADLIYGLLAVAGIRLAVQYARLSAIVGGAFLLYLAWRSWGKTTATDVAMPKGQSLFGSTATTFALTLSNPMTILSFAALVASTGAEAPTYFVLGIFSGSMLWWAMLSTSAGWLGARIDIRGAVLNRLAAVTLALFGVWAIWNKGLR